jgi:hypothetical protein
LLPRAPSQLALPLARGTAAGAPHPLQRICSRLPRSVPAHGRGRRHGRPAELPVSAWLFPFNPPSSEPTTPTCPQRLTEPPPPFLLVPRSPESTRHQSLLLLGEALVAGPPRATSGRAVLCPGCVWAPPCRSATAGPFLAAAGLDELSVQHHEEEEEGPMCKMETSSGGFLHCHRLI